MKGANRILGKCCTLGPGCYGCDILRDVVLSEHTCMVYEIAHRSTDVTLSWYVLFLWFCCEHEWRVF